MPVRRHRLQGHISEPSGVQGRMKRIAFSASVATALVLLYSCHSSQPRRNGRAIAAAEDSVYEAVVRYMLQSNGGQSSVKQLVFDEALAVWPGVVSGTARATCEQGVLNWLKAGSGEPSFNSLADKIYRFISRGGDDYSLRPDTIQDFAERACTGGRVSQAFHTELPRTFTAGDSVYFEGWPVGNDSAKSFERFFPGASGLISFSHVGFDASLDQAIVFTSFVCGGLCGTGKVYVLRKRLGSWRVVSQWTVWVS